MKLAKYIILHKLGIEVAVLFHAGISHNEAVNPAELKAQGTTLVSAGFFQVMPDGAIYVHPDAGSTTLGLRPRPEDAEVIETTLFLLGLGQTVAA